MNWTPHILYEDNHYLAINKPVGLAVQPESASDEAIIPLLQDYIGKREKKPGKAFIGVLHRLDKLVSGVLILAKTSKGQERFNELLKNKQVTKYYLALTPRKNMPESGRLVHYFSRHDEEYKMTVSLQRKNSTDQEAILNYKIIAVFDQTQCFSIELVTGRRHQIRAQLAYLGCPILGDKRYGSNVQQPNLSLHCVYMAFVHPIKKELIEVRSVPDHIGAWHSYKAKIQDVLRTYRPAITT